MTKGILIVVSAPAGCGKDTILEQALSKNNNLFYSVSATSRAIRPGETDGANYYFKTRSQFENMIKNNELLEYTEYVGNYYGTPKKAVIDMLATGKDVVLKIEIEGAMNVRKLFPGCTTVFILPPSFWELERRLRKRGTETEEIIKQRLETARRELSFADKYDYLVTNDELNVAVDDFLAIVRAEKCRRDNRTGAVEELLAE